MATGGTCCSSAGPLRGDMSAHEVRAQLQEHLGGTMLRLRSRWHTQTRGIPQGAVTSPLLCSLHLRHVIRTELLPQLVSACSPEDDQQAAHRSVDTVCGRFPLAPVQACAQQLSPAAQHTASSVAAELQYNSAPVAEPSAHAVTAKQQRKHEAACSVDGPTEEAVPPLLMHMADDFLLLVAGGEEHSQAASPSPQHSRAARRAAAVAAAGVRCGAFSAGVVRWQLDIASACTAYVDHARETLYDNVHRSSSSYTSAVSGALERGSQGAHRSAGKMRCNMPLELGGVEVVAVAQTGRWVPWCGVLLDPATMTLRVRHATKLLTSAC